MEFRADACTVCGFRRIPGITSCVNCGEPEGEAFPITIEVRGSDGQPIIFDLSRDYTAENAKMRERSRRLMEARALEYAGDAETATSIYESLVADDIPYTPPYRRLAILYHKAKREADEERVIRAAIGRFGGGPGEWFVLRLAKILAKRR